MKKIVKQWGDSLVVRFSKEEVEIYRLKKEDVLDIDIKKVKFVEWNPKKNLKTG